MAIKNEFVPKFAVHPGRMLLEEIKARHMSQVEFAERTGMTPKHLSEIINGKADVTPEVAIAVEAATGTPASLWLKLQMQYDEVLARQKETETLRADEEIVGLFSYTKIRAIWPALPDTRKTTDRIIALRQMFCVSSLKLLVDNIYNDKFTISPAFRTSGKTEDHEIDRYALAAWVQVGKLKAAKETLSEEYHPNELKKFAKQIPALSAEADVSHAWNQIREGLNACGVKIVLVPYLPRTYINGAVYWEDSTPVVILNVKTSYWDTFIFTLLHEVGHILLHGKTYTSLSFDPTHAQLLSADQKEEKEADEFSLNTLISPMAFDSFVEKYRSGSESVKHFAQEYPVDCGIVAARMAKREIIGWPYCRQFRRQVQIG